MVPGFGLLTILDTRAQGTSMALRVRYPVAHIELYPWSDSGTNSLEIDTAHSVWYNAMASTS
jgi:hypothetical protein